MPSGHGRKAPSPRVSPASTRAALNAAPSSSSLPRAVYGGDNAPHSFFTLRVRSAGQAAGRAQTDTELFSYHTKSRAVVHISAVNSTFERRAPFPTADRKSAPQDESHKFIINDINNKSFYYSEINFCLLPRALTTHWALNRNYAKNAKTDNLSEDYFVI